MTTGNARTCDVHGTPLETYTDWHCPRCTANDTPAEDAETTPTDRERDLETARAIIRGMLFRTKSEFPGLIADALASERERVRQTEGTRADVLRTGLQVVLDLSSEATDEDILAAAARAGSAPPVRTYEDGLREAARKLRECAAALTVPHPESAWMLCLASELESLAAAQPAAPAQPSAATADECGFDCLGDTGAHVDCPVHGVKKRAHPDPSEAVRLLRELTAAEDSIRACDVIKHGDAWDEAVIEKRKVEARIRSYLSRSATPARTAEDEPRDRELLERLFDAVPKCWPSYGDSPEQQVLTAVMNDVHHHIVGHAPEPEPPRLTPEIIEERLRHGAKNAQALHEQLERTRYLRPEQSGLVLRGSTPSASAPADESCTGVSARWCPLHGDCECELLPDGSSNFDNDACPLHGDKSDHAENDAPAAPVRSAADERADVVAWLLARGHGDLRLYSNTDLTEEQRVDRMLIGRVQIACGKGIERGEHEGAARAAAKDGGSDG